MAEKTASFDKQRTIPAIQTGMDRYIQIKCKRSPLNTVGNKVKINKSNVHARSTNGNRLCILAEAENNQAKLGR